MLLYDYPLTLLLLLSINITIIIKYMLLYILL